MVYWKSKKLKDNTDFLLENKMLHDNLCVFIIISAFLHLIHLLSLCKSVVYLPFIYVFYDECSEDVRWKYSSAKYTMRN